MANATVLCSAMETKTLQDMVNAAASIHGARIAVTYDSGTDASFPVSLSYSELTGLGNELTHLLREQQNTNIIALYCHTDVNLPVWILGILQVPAAYVPLDPEAPALLSAHIVDQCVLKYCVVQRDLLEQFQRAFSSLMSIEVCAVLVSHNLALVRLQRSLAAGPDSEGADGTDTNSAAPGAADCPAPAVHHAQGAVGGGVDQGQLAYVLHTSGTTGTPKTVRVPHKCIVPNILHLRSLFQMTSDDVVFLASPLTFDPSVVDIFLALSSGARLLIVPTVIKKMPNRLSRVLFKNHNTTFLQVTPTLLGRFGKRLLQEEVLSAASPLRVLALGGEACPSPGVLRSWRQEGNRTLVYNIYGVTEVSCWACCYRLPETEPLPTDQAEPSVPLGAPLMDTTVEVRDEQGHIVTEGEGQVFIGGQDRVCLLDGEVSAVPGTMRATGDWVRVRDAQLYYLGRRDRLIKRHGQRVHLDALQQVLLRLPQVESCAVGLYSGFRLVAFVVAAAAAAASSAPGDQKAAAAPSASSQQGELLSASPRALLRTLAQLVPAPSVPDTLLLVPALPLTPHGKVDMSALMKTYRRQRAASDLRCPRRDMESLRETLQAMWRDSLGLAEDAGISEDANFLFSGGDSLRALALCDDIITATGATSSGLLEVILDRSFSDVVRHVAAATPTPRAKKRRTDPLYPPTSTQRHRTDPPPTSERLLGVGVSAEPEAVRWTVVRRAGQVTEIQIGDADGPITRPADAPTLAGGSNGDGAETGGLRLRLRWSSDTGRCVDASPVLLARGGRAGGGASGRTSAFIGSHSHRMQALDLASGGLLWERVLGGRVEASAAVTVGGAMLAVGCYDGCVYFLCVDTGETRWTFQTGDAVKSSPALDPQTGLVIAGSHDGHVYALDPQARRCVWRRACGGGAVFSSPCVHPALRRLYVATLGGRLLCLSPDGGAVLWTYSRDAPFFSSPICSQDRVFIGSVDGNICCLSQEGALVWQFATDGPVFSSPCVSPDKRAVLCGSHDGRVYCLSCADGAAVWSFQTSGRVYASPTAFDGALWGQQGALVGLASTDGTLWILDGRDGTLRASLALPGELFSSPVVWGRSLVVGCRNDFVYCVEMTGRMEVKQSCV